MTQDHCYYESVGFFLQWVLKEPTDEGETDKFLETLWSSGRIGKKHFQSNKQKNSFQKRALEVLLRAGSNC